MAQIAEKMFVFWAVCLGFLPDLGDSPLTWQSLPIFLDQVQRWAVEKLVFQHKSVYPGFVRYCREAGDAEGVGSRFRERPFQG
jgi:hypothetical protein